MSKRHHVNARLRIWPECEEMEPALKRGELRLAGEVHEAMEQGYIVPLTILRRAQATFRNMRG